MNEQIDVVQEEKQHQRTLNEHVAATKLDLEENVKYRTTWITEMENEVHKSKQEVKKVAQTARRRR